MRLKESIIIILLLFILIGGVNAADNQTDDLAVSDNDIVAVDVTPVDESTDSSGIKTVEQNISNVAKATSNGEILSASAQNDVLGDASYTGTTFTELKNQMSGKEGVFTFTNDCLVSRSEQTASGTGVGSLHLGISIDKFTLIEGNNHKIYNINNDSVSRIFTMSTGDVVIQNLKFENLGLISGDGITSLFGSVIDATGGTITLKNCTFNNNYNSQCRYCYC